MELNEAIEILTSDNFCKLQSNIRSSACEIIAQNFCNELGISYIPFIIDNNLDENTDGNYSARKKE